MKTITICGCMRLEAQLGLQRGTVALQSYCVQWGQAAKETIELLRSVLKDGAVDIQHVGSTAIRGIHAKPIIDIAVGMKDFETVTDHIPALEQVGIHYRKQDVQGQHLFVMGEGDTRTHHIHFVEWNDAAWNNYINFRDYLNHFPEKAQAYDTLKRQWADEFQNDRGSYTAGKHGLIDQFLQEAKLWKVSMQKLISRP